MVMSGGRASNPGGAHWRRSRVLGSDEELSVGQGTGQMSTRNPGQGRCSAGIWETGSVSHVASW